MIPRHNGWGAGEWLEYSFEEREVGTWVDGSPIYQRSFHGMNPVTVQDLSIITVLTYAQMMAAGHNPTNNVMLKGEVSVARTSAAHGPLGIRSNNIGAVFGTGLGANAVIQWYPLINTGTLVTNTAIVTLWYRKSPVVSE